MPCFWDPHARGSYHSVCLSRACVKGALIRHGRAAGVGATPWVQGGGDWHRGWAENVGRPARDGAQLGGVRAHGRVAGRAKLCLPTVRSRACVDAWAGAASCGSFLAVAPVAVWVLGLLLRETLVDYGNTPECILSG
jgi:hypothetical protein